MSKNLMNNPINAGPILLWGSLAIVAFLIALLWIIYEDGFDWGAVVICALPALFFFIMVPGRLEFIDRPKEVEVTDSGVVIYKRLGMKQELLPWSDIIGISHITSRSRKRDSSVTNSYIRTSRNRRYTVTWQIAEVIQEEYKKKMGHYPQNRMEIK